jgi:DNA-binding NarL/FixJ family response regulator
MTRPPGTSASADAAPTPRIRVLLVDDQPLIRMGFRMVLESHDDLAVVGEADDGASALRAAEALKPDVIVMDVRMPGMDGIRATAALAERLPRTRVLIVTTYDVDEYAFAGLRAGASGFLLKSAQPAELVDAIRTIASGDAVVEPRITRRLLELFGDQLPTGSRDEAAGSRGGRADPRLAALTERELEVFSAIAKGMSNADISRALYLSESTVKTHIGRILLKLDLRDRVHAVILGYETGIVAPGKPSGA